MLAALIEAKFPSLSRHTGLEAAAIFGIVLVYVGIVYLFFERNTDYIRRFVESRILRRSDLHVAPSVLANR
jgi:hypothetical protein